MLQSEETLEAIQRLPGVVLVIGASDSGKTTWVKSAVGELGRTTRSPIAIVDGDIGQASIGPPATVALGLLRHPPQEERQIDLPCEALSFIGSVTPVGYFLPLLIALKRHVDQAKAAGAEHICVDTTGLIAPGIGFQLKLRKIELLEPHHLVTFEHHSELEMLITVARARPDLEIHRHSVDPQVRRRSATERTRYRRDSFAAYFLKSRLVALASDQLVILAPSRRSYGKTMPDLVTPSMLKDDRFSRTLIGLNNGKNETIALGLFDSLDEKTAALRVWTPAQETGNMRIVQLGSLRLNNEWEALPV